MIRQRSCFVVLVLTSMLALPAVAHETGIYESLDHIHIGRVFLTPHERVDLDANRNVVVMDTVAGSAAGEQKPERGSDLAAGYIVSSSGGTRVWKDGDFVAAEIPASIRFPGDVKVTRNADSAAESSDAAGRDDDASVAGAADDAN